MNWLPAFQEIATERCSKPLLHLTKHGSYLDPDFGPGWTRDLRLPAIDKISDSASISGSFCRRYECRPIFSDDLPDASRPFPR